MKLTWFGGTTLRVYLGGQIVVVDAERAPAGVDRAEVAAGADRVVSVGDPTISSIDPGTWRPKPIRPMDDTLPAEILAIGPASLLISVPGEPPLVILGAGEPPRYGRWADGAVVVLTSGAEAAVAEATVLLDVARPRLIALAADEQDLDRVVEELAEHLDGAGLVSLEPGLALEV